MTAQTVRSSINVEALLKTDEKGITKVITGLHNRGDSLQLDIHKALVLICMRWAKSGDMRPVAGHINHLLQKDKLGGVRKNAIRLWVETFMKLELGEGDRSNEFYVPKEVMDGKHLDIKTLTNNRWWEFKPEEDYKPIDDPMKLFMSLKAKLEKDRSKAGSNSKVTPEMLALFDALKPAADATVQ